MSYPDSGSAYLMQERAELMWADYAVLDSFAYSMLSSKKMLESARLFTNYTFMSLH